ncbi:MAG: DUF4959 domain-containing protein [Bacteroidota bacterium]|nr:DUF4959 domain-containing protein [Bacteroidota bacterium]
MKKYSIIVTLGLLVFCFFSCEQSDKNALKPWNSGAIEGYVVTPINGGATISYTIPNDSNILYVMAEYKRNGKIFTEKSSVYKNTLTIEGFDNQNSVKVALYKVNKHEQKSEPVTLEFEPLESLVSIAKNSLKFTTGFGGIIASWDNPKETELGVHLMVEDASKGNQLVTATRYFSELKNDSHSFRGFEAKETTFAIAFEDKWGNISDTVRYTTTPFFERVIPKPYADYRSFIPYDNTSNLSGRNIATLWDNIVNTSGHGWLTQPGNSGLSMTFDIKEVAKLSRIVIHGYHINSPYGQANITEFELWGTNKIDLDLLSNQPYWLDETSLRNGAILKVPANTPLPARTFKNDWQYLGYHSIPIYTTSAAINEQSANGTEYTMPITAAPVRYVRLFVRAIAKVSPPPANNYWSMGEITFYGDDTVPQQ